MSEGAFFQDLAVLMAASGLVAVIFQRLKWPKVIGYLLAGILMSRHTWGGSFLSEGSSIPTIGQLGIVFLMLTLGLEFSAGALKKVKGVSGPMALVDSVVMIWIGYTVGRRIFGWDSVPSLFLGAAICDSATTLLAKTIDEMKWSKRPFVKYVISTSIRSGLFWALAVISRKQETLTSLRFRFRLTMTQTIQQLCTSILSVHTITFLLTWDRTDFLL